MDIKFICFLAAITGALPISNANSSEISVKVTLIRSPCKINGGKSIKVEFDTAIDTARIDGNNYLKVIPYTIFCPDVQYNTGMKIKMVGEDVGKGVLKTSVDGLGLQLKVSGDKMPVNEWVNFAYGFRPLLQAVPVRTSSDKLVGGDFEATASMLVDYQ